ncbi:EAL domain-containing protein [Vibrio ostreicida]|uniref:EAL domain-containing protein n=1 Tax=Vibrio ostreicida TaxID=526588 RepID=A0ABT8BZ19_9VIBR|nr:GGDEF domain-containing phosphodiesterase [Vibrio ostreicida]MDN3612405.1 EAL domain-containing protein [Vibrio ostreicida]NPD09826.1 EAL domain-containing protein [Vibrio ostreicida]
MAKIKTATSSIDIDVVNATLQLDGAELLNKVTLVLHEQFKSFCTCIIEIDKFNFNAQTLSYACNNGLKEPVSYSLRGTPCAHVSKSELDFVIYDDVAAEFPDDIYIREHQLKAYLGIPLRTRSGDILGVLLSTFQSPLEETQDLVYYHSFFANLVVHSLREKWLSARSDSLVKQLSYEVSHDNLTGLLDRSMLSSTLESLPNADSGACSLAYVDIDNFKSINGLYGNYIGDQVIKFVAQVIETSIQNTRYAFRIAGDEFAFVTYHGDPLEVCCTILNKLESGYRDPNHNINVSVSIGIARKNHLQVTADQLIFNASLALKECKQSRTSKVQCYDTHLSAQYYRRTMVIDALRNELDTNNHKPSEIYVLAQPIVRKGQSNWKYFEILARWQSSVLGMVSPLEFIEAAEQSGLIVELGERIVELACQAKQELEQGLGYKTKLGINCSAYELNNTQKYLGNLISNLNKYGFSPNEFTIELTETVLLSQTNDISSVLNQLRTMGFTIALDDFGTGYSSLNYIHSYPIDCIKIDATFVRNILSNKTSERVVWLIIQLAQYLNVDLVAEGVESQDTLSQLHHMGCDQIQGYFYSRPERPNTIIEAQRGIDTPQKHLNVLR